MSDPVSNQDVATKNYVDTHAFTTAGGIKLYLGFNSFLVFYRSDSEVMVVILIVSGSNPLLTNTSTSSDLL